MLARSQIGKLDLFSGFLDLNLLIGVLVLNHDDINVMEETEIIGICADCPSVVNFFTSCLKKRKNMEIWKFSSISSNFQSCTKLEVVST